MKISRCEMCNIEIRRRGETAGRFCSRKCKGEWQKTQKPVDKEWLYQKYVVEGLGTYQIGKIVNRNPKQVYMWLVGYDIEIRKRTWSTEAGGQPFHDEKWLFEEYITKQRSSQEIANEFNVSDSLIFFWLDKFGIAGRTIGEARAIKHWELAGEVNGMYGKRGEESPSWKGGCTPERQVVYSSIEWSEASRTVWQRDEGKCQRCHVKANDKAILHIHHIVSFAVKELRTIPSNLVLLCIDCHHFVHSKNNVDKLFIQEGGNYETGI